MVGQNAPMRVPAKVDYAIQAAAELAAADPARLTSDHIATAQHTPAKYLGNILVDDSGGLFVVDWDAPLLAPAEKDLVLVLSGLSGEHAATDAQIALFWRGYGARPVDPVALEFYRCVRRLEDITSFAANLLRDDVGEATRRDDLYWFVRQFSS